ncbi:MAG TPA: outer membrane protein transport protein [Steroidobacteraceae bacterium]|nr:outer membrane protein transport protein [Steroidobacteraceae bacterium]
MRRCIYVLVSGLIGALASATALASGFQLQEQSASGLGVAYSGMAAAVQDGSTVFWNPAGMSQLGGSGLAVAADYVIPSFKFTSAGSAFDAFGNGGDGGVSSLVPAVYGYTAITPQLSLGLGVNAPFGLSTEWHSPWAGMFYGIRSKVETLNINPVVSWKVNQFLSIGGGVSYEQLKATLTQGLTPLIPSAQGRVDGSDWGWGWNLGALVDFGQGTTLGATYRSAIGYTITGNLGFNNAAFAALAAGISARLRLPQIFSVALSQKLTPQLRLLADFTETGWDSISALTIIATNGPAAGTPVSNTPLNFKNSWRVGAGLEYQLNPQWLLRGGVAYDQAPVQDAFRNPRLPDNDRTWLAVGARFEPAAGWAIDAGYAYLRVKNGTSELATAGPPFPDSLMGTYRANVSVLGLQASFHF